MAKAEFTSITEIDFKKKALDLFRDQFHNIEVYQSYCRLLGKDLNNVSSLNEIPFLPISFFKSHKIFRKNLKEEGFFMSSGTTAQPNRSRHYYHSLEGYEQSFLTFFEATYGPISDIILVALLPSYKEQTHSSLIYMVDHIIKKAKPGSGYYKLGDQQLTKLFASDQKKLLIGVTYALLDWAESNPMALQNTIVMETGGMKGRRKEVVREEVHQQLKTAFKLDTIHSEYGMTELFSQAYSPGEGIFYPAPWMKVLIREAEDPFTISSHEKTGGINIIDLANTHSCAFIATEDLGKTHSDGSFEVLGRFDTAEIRGCNLMMA
jgi:phenylacetate-coenzyme A ligase PaaK-like adenylate-forming protein